MQLNDATEKTFIPTKLNFNILFRLILVLVNFNVKYFVLPQVIRR